MTNVTKGADDGESINVLVDHDDVGDDDDGGGVGGGVANSDANILFFRSHSGLGESLCPQL